MAKKSSSGLWIDIKDLMSWTKRLCSLIKDEDSLYRDKITSINIECVAAFSMSYFYGNKDIPFIVNDESYNLRIEGKDYFKVLSVLLKLEEYKFLYEFIFKHLSLKDNPKEIDKVHKNIFTLLAKIERGLQRWKGNLRCKFVLTTKSKNNVVSIL